MIVLYGATGFTGRLAAGALLEGGADLVVAGRDEARVRVLGEALGVPAAVADARDPDALAAAFAGAAVVVSCAGPFARVGRPVAEAAVAAGAHYVDSTGEPEFMRWAYSRLHGPARDAGVAAVPASGFDYLPGDVAASMLLAQLGPVRRIDYVYATESSASPGTGRSTLAVLRDGGYAVRGGRLVPVVPAAESRRVQLASARQVVALAPLGDPLCAHRRLGVEEASSWMLLRRVTLDALRVGGRAVPLALRGPVGAAADRLAARRSDPSLAERARARFTVRVEAVGRRGVRGAVELAGVDSYAVTARALAWRALALAAGDVPAPGALTPAEGGDPLTLVRALGLTVTET